MWGLQCLRWRKLRALPGDLWVSVDQPRGRLAALTLEPRSTSSLVRMPQYTHLG